MPSEMTEEEQARAEVALVLVQAVQVLNDAMATAAKLGVYAKLSIYTLPPAIAGPGKPRQTYAISIEAPGQPSTD